VGGGIKSTAPLEQHCLKGTAKGAWGAKCATVRQKEWGRKVGPVLNGKLAMGITVGKLGGVYSDEVAWLTINSGGWGKVRKSPVRFVLLVCQGGELTP